MARPRFATADAQLRERVLDAARKEFAANGYEAASLNRILIAAGLSKGAFYYYFDDKLDLAATVFAELAPSALAMMEELRLPDTAGDFWVELRRNSHARLVQMHADRLSYEAAMRLANALLKYPELAARVLPMFQPGRQKIMAFFARGQELGALRGDLPVPAMLEMMEALKTSMYRALYPGDQILTEAQLESFTDLVLDAGRRLFQPVKP